MLKSFYILISSCEKIRVEAQLIQHNNNNFFVESINSFSVLVGEFKHQYLDNILKFSKEEFIDVYVIRMNQLGIYFKHQLHDIKLICENDIKESINLSDIKFFFNKSIDDIHSLLLLPNDFIDNLDATINSAISLNSSIVDNYDAIYKKDKELLFEKNEILNSMNVFKFNEIFEIVKKREKLSYVLIDIDTEIANILVELNYIKYLNIKKDSPIECLKTFNKWSNNLKRIENEYKQCLNFL